MGLLTLVIRIRITRVNKPLISVAGRERDCRLQSNQVCLQQSVQEMIECDRRVGENDTGGASGLYREETGKKPGRTPKKPGRNECSFKNRVREKHEWEFLHLFHVTRPPLSG